MFENYDFDYIMDNMLSKVPDTIDKREGSIIYDALAPSATELENMYVALDMILNEGFADTASYYYLIKRAAERGIFPTEATSAVLKMITEPNTVNVNIGERFNLDELNYIVTAKISDGIYKVQCETTGTEGNGHFGELIPIDFIQNLQKATIAELLVPGEEEEAEEDFRNRYFSSLNSQAFGGNVTDYKEKVNALNGVGGVKVVRAWNGGGTVKLIIINSTYTKPSAELIQSVQTEIDPVEGAGYGIAPIGHVVAVDGITESIINISSTITYQDGYNFEDIKSFIESAIDSYFTELAREWADNDNLVVRISQIETRLLNVTGILDIANTKLNNQDQNITLSLSEIPKRGEVVG